MQVSQAIGSLRFPFPVMLFSLTPLRGRRLPFFILSSSCPLSAPGGPAHDVHPSCCQTYPTLGAHSHLHFPMQGYPTLRGYPIYIRDNRRTFLCISHLYSSSSSARGARECRPGPREPRPGLYRPDPGGPTLATSLSMWSRSMCSLSRARDTLHMTRTF